jgi:hypothetical protein
VTEHAKAVGTIEGSRGSSDELLRSTIEVSREAVDALVQLGQRHELNLPVESLHVLELGEQIAWLTLEALRSWPRPDQPPG